MKMKEVCEKTGLTERAVRFYVEKGLIAPASTEVRGRDYMDFSAENVEQLRVVSDLRKIEFSIGEIDAMQRTPEKIPEILAGYRERIEEDAQKKAQLVQALSRLDFASVTSPGMLAMRMRSVSAARVNPDVRLNFDKMEDLEASEKEKEYQKFLERQRALCQRGETIVVAVIAVTLIFEVISLFQNFNLLGLIIQIVLCVGLYRGRAWGRYLLAIGSLLSAFLNMIVAFQAAGQGVEIGVFGGIVIAGLVALAAAQGIVLFVSKSVDAFLYYQKNG